MAKFETHHFRKTRNSLSSFVASNPYKENRVPPTTHFMLEMHANPSLFMVFAICDHIKLLSLRLNRPCKFLSNASNCILGKNTSVLQCQKLSEEERLKIFQTS